MNIAPTHESYKSIIAEARKVANFIEAQEKPMPLGNLVSTSIVTLLRTMADRIQKEA